MQHVYQWIGHEWKLLAAGLALALALALVLWLIFRRRPTPEELERLRRRFLIESGRLSDGMSNDIFIMTSPEGRVLTMLLYTYRIGGVDYECSQDVTTLINADDVRIGFPCSVRYQPGNPQNSIVVAEGWSGLRLALPVLPKYNDPEPTEMRASRRARS